MKLKGICIFVLLILNISVAQAGGLSAEQAQKFLTISGLQSGIDALPMQLEQQINLQRLLAEDVVEHEKVGGMLNEAVANVDGQTLATNYLTSHPKAKSLSNTIEFLETDLGKRIVVAENQASASDFQVGMQEFAHQMATNNDISAKRQALIVELVKSLHVEDVMMNMVKGMMYSMLDIFKAVKPEIADFMAAELDKEWKGMEGVLKGQFSQYLMISTHYIYKDVSDQDLSDYIVFLESADGQVYWMASIDIFNLYLNAFIKNFTNIILESEQANQI